MEPKLQKSKYKREELVKAVDIRIRELIKEERLEKNEIVPLEEYNLLLEEFNELIEEEKRLKKEIEETTKRTEVLQEQIDELLIVLELESIKDDVIKNQLTAHQSRFQSLNDTFIQSQQRSVQETVDEATIKSTYDGLKAELNALIDIRASLLSGLINETGIELTGAFLTDVNDGIDRTNNTLIEVVTQSNEIQNEFQTIFERLRRIENSTQVPPPLNPPFRPPSGGGGGTTYVNPNDTQPGEPAPGFLPSEDLLRVLRLQ